MASEKLTILEELRNEIPPLSSEEIMLLENSIVKDGIRDALVVWQKDGEAVLVDGHNRYSIAQKYGKQYDVVFKEFEDLLDVKIWIRNNQMARRNLTDGWKAELVLRNKDDLLAKGREKLQEAGEKGNTIRWQEEASPLSETDKPDAKTIFPENISLPETDKDIKPTEEKHNTREKIAEGLSLYEKFSSEFSISS